MNLQTLTAPSAWVSALINSDYSGLDTEESRHVAHWLKINNVYAVLGTPADDEPRFTWQFRLYDPLADCNGGSVTDFVCDVRGAP